MKRRFYYVDLGFRSRVLKILVQRVHTYTLGYHVMHLLDLIRQVAVRLSYITGTLVALADVCLALIEESHDAITKHDS